MFLASKLEFKILQNSTFQHSVLTISSKAQIYFANLLSQQANPDLAIRIFTSFLNSADAEVGITFIEKSAAPSTDKILPYPGFDLYMAADSEESLLAANIDYADEDLDTKLSIKAPRLKQQRPSQNAPILEQIDYVLKFDINPMLASHRGQVSLKEWLEPDTLVLAFGGGCHGCNMVNVTLKGSVEKIIREKIPQIRAIIDATDHESGKNPYYSN